MDQHEDLKDATENSALPVHPRIPLEFLDLFHSLAVKLFHVKVTKV